VNAPLPPPRPRPGTAAVRHAATPRRPLGDPGRCGGPSGARRRVGRVGAPAGRPGPARQALAGPGSARVRRRRQCEQAPRAAPRRARARRPRRRC